LVTGFGAFEGAHTKQAYLDRTKSLAEEFVLLYGHLAQAAI
jgi:hypothetical protein